MGNIDDLAEAFFAEEKDRGGRFRWGVVHSDNPYVVLLDGATNGIPITDSLVKASNGARVMVWMEGMRSVIVGASGEMSGASGALPTGAIIPWAGEFNIHAGNFDSTSPVEPVPGWLLCNGAGLDAGKYAGLFRAIGHKYSAQKDLPNYFQLPNLIGRLPYMPTQELEAKFGANWVGDVGGENAHQQTEGEVGRHAHYQRLSVPAFDPNSSIQRTDWRQDFSGATIVDQGLTTHYAGDSLPFNIVQAYLVMAYLIKY